mmetsp:Transcript_15308/g.36131  ORF Transcript_15308/g.36131 Transcript_15308/m.36131 type:complete len:239 (-) Transcript_15308:145-861(-)
MRLCTDSSSWPRSEEISASRSLTRASSWLLSRGSGAYRRSTGRTSSTAERTALRMDCISPHSLLLASSTLWRWLSISLVSSCVLAVRAALYSCFRRFCDLTQSALPSAIARRSWSVTRWNLRAVELRSPPSCCWAETEACNCLICNSMAEIVSQDLCQSSSSLFLSARRLSLCSFVSFALVSAVCLDMFASSRSCLAVASSSSISSSSLFFSSSSMLRSSISSKASSSVHSRSGSRRP